MNEDPRCCGSSACIIDTEGRCWCGQQWDGREMCRAPRVQAESAGRAGLAEPLHLFERQAVDRRG